MANTMQIHCHEEPFTAGLQDLPSCRTNSVNLSCAGVEVTFFVPYGREEAVAVALLTVGAKLLEAKRDGNGEDAG